MIPLFFLCSDSPFSGSKALTSAKDPPSPRRGMVGSKVFSPREVESPNGKDATPSPPRLRDCDQPSACSVVAPVSEYPYNSGVEGASPFLSDHEGGGVS